MARDGSNGMRRALDRAARRIERGDPAGAEAELRGVLRACPTEPDALNLSGLVHLERREYAAAVEAFSLAMRIRVPFPEAMINLSVACNRTGEHDLARQLCETVLGLQPGNVLARLNLGMAWKGLGRLERAREAFEAAGPHAMARFNLGHTLLLEGDLERGLPLFEERRGVLRIGAGLAGRPWDGAPLPGASLLVVPEQGLGDVILMSRFLPALADRFVRVTVLAPPPLARLVGTLDPRLAVIEDTKDGHWDVWAPVLSLPWLLGVRSLDQVPTAPWIRVGGPARAPGRPRVGINWAGNPSFAYDTVRSTSLESFAPLLAVRDVDWVSLHRGVREHEAEAFLGLPQPLREAADFLDTAEVIAGLDLVISTETAIPNLSAAMGVPTCVMTVKDVDWRWQGWYEGVTVCDQDAAGNWFGPVAKAAEALLRLLVARAA